MNTLSHTPIYAPIKVSAILEGKQS